MTAAQQANGADVPCSGGALRSGGILGAAPVGGRDSQVGPRLIGDPLGGRDVPLRDEGAFTFDPAHSHVRREISPLNSTDPLSLGYKDVDGNASVSTLIANMDSTSKWEATKRLRRWEADELRLIEGEKLLDIGCGTADAALSLATLLGRTGELVGIDASTVMIEEARRRSVGTPCAVRFIVGNAQSLNEADSLFDVVRSERTLQWLQDPGAAISECARVLRDRGRLSLIDTDWSTFHIDVSQPEISQMIRRAFETERNRPSNIGRRLTHLAKAAGFRVVATETATQIWTAWNPDEAPAPVGFFSMQSLADDLVDAGELDCNAKAWFVDAVYEAARCKRFEMSLTMHGIVAVLP